MRQKIAVYVLDRSRFVDTLALSVFYSLVSTIRQRSDARLWAHWLIPFSTRVKAYWELHRTDHDFPFCLNNPPRGDSALLEAIVAGVEWAGRPSYYGDIPDADRVLTVIAAGVVLPEPKDLQIARVGDLMADALRLGCQVNYVQVGQRADVISPELIGLPKAAIFSANDLGALMRSFVLQVDKKITKYNI